MRSEGQIIQGIFQHRSGRVIALGRFVLAAVFLIAIWLDPSQPKQGSTTAYGLMLLYVSWTGTVLLLTWSNWWLDHRLAAFAHLVDIAAFGTLVFFTEGYTSPFYTFFVFLLLSAAIRWSWRETALTAVAVLVLFFVAGAAALSLGTTGLDFQRLLVRLTQLVVLSLLLIWFGVNQQPAAPSAEELEIEPGAETPPVEAMLRHAARRLNARRMLAAWWQKEEPWLNLAELDNGRFRSERSGPEAYGRFVGDESRGLPFLFDVAAGRAIRRDRRRPHRLVRFAQPIDPALATSLRLDQGLAIPFRAREYEGEMFALSIDGLCGDDLHDAETLGQEVGTLFDRVSIMAFSEEAAVLRARRSLARDLHDSVVQVLAGASFRLEALKAWIRAGHDPDPEIEAVKGELAVEQRNVRSFIADLRSGRGSMQPTDLCAGMPDLGRQLRHRWNVDFELSLPETAIRGPAWIEHELHQIIREAAANAVRHGRATQVTVAIRRSDGELELSISDNGKGFPGAAKERPFDGTPPSPWSVHERAKGLGGTLSLVSGPKGSTITICLPLEAAP